MEFNIDRNELLEGVQKTLSITEKKNVTPIFSSILLTVDERGLNILSTDRELLLISQFACEVFRSGAVVLQAKKLYEIIRECQGNVVHVEQGVNQMVRITCGRAIFKMYGQPEENYPKPVIEETSSQARIVSSDLIRDLIQSTQYAVSNDETKKNIVGIFFHSLVEDGRSWLVMVATDGNRLAYFKKEAPEGDWSFLTPGVIIHKRGLAEVKKLIEDSSREEVTLWIEQGAIVFKTSSTYLRVNLIADQYPNYQKVIPLKWEGTVQFFRADALHALRRMAVLATDEDRVVFMDINGDKAVLTSGDNELGDAREELDVIYDGADMKIAFNVSYLLAAMEVIKEEQVIFHLNSQRKACLMRAAGSEDYKGLIMPLRIQR